MVLNNLTLDSCLFVGFDSFYIVHNEKASVSSFSLCISKKKARILQRVVCATYYWKDKLWITRGTIAS